MTDDYSSNRDLLEAIFVTQVMLLSHELRREARAKGVTRMGGDYYGEAARLISQDRRKVLSALHNTL